MCRNGKVPLNFFSWHCYTSDPAELGARALAIRRLLDEKGFTGTENHLNEWNYLPGNTWKPIAKEGTPLARQRFYEAMAGAPGAAFIAASLLELQDDPVDIGNFFHGEPGGFGIFNGQGVPLKAYQALCAFQGLLETPRRAETRGAVAGKLAFAGGLRPDGREAAMLVSNFADPREEMVLNWKDFAWAGGVTAEIRTVEDTRDFSSLRTGALRSESTLRLVLKAPALALISLSFRRGDGEKDLAAEIGKANL